MTSPTNAAKRRWYIMPGVFVTYSLAYLDRANFSFSPTAGITEDLGITKGIASLLGRFSFSLTFLWVSRCLVSVWLTIIVKPTQNQRAAARIAR